MSSKREPADPIKLFVGWDPREPVVNAVFKSSVLAHTTRPVSFQDVALKPLGHMGVWWREPVATQSTDFAFARFMVPFLCGYRGWAIFADGDMLCRDDLTKLWNLRNPHYAVQVVKHHHVPRETTKFLDNIQTRNRRKNWSSVMLFNNERCKMLTPEMVNEGQPAYLHQFKWVMDEEIGSLPRFYNHLVGTYPYDKNAKIVHFTIGAPAWEEYQDCDYADEWREALNDMLHVSKKESMLNAGGAA